MKRMINILLIILIVIIPCIIYTQFVRILQTRKKIIGLNKELLK